MILTPPGFAPHGQSQFERHGRVLLLRSQGPFNAELIRTTAQGFRALAEALAPEGPWATVNVVSHSMMGTPEALQALRDSTEMTSRRLARVAAAYVADAQVEGRGLMIPLLRQALGDLLALEFFSDVDAALHWAEQQIVAAKPATG